MRSLFFTALLLLTASCTQETFTSNCLPLKTWSKEEEIQAATDLGHLTAESPVFGMIDDYWNLHKRIEACHGIRPKRHKSQPVADLANDD